MTEHPYLRRAYAAAAGRDPGQTAFLQTLESLYESIAPSLEDQPLYALRGLPERLGEPERTCLFPVAWTDDRGRTRTARGLYIRYNTVLGPGRPGLMLGPGMDLDRAKAAALELSLCRALAGLGLGGALAGADAAPGQMSAGESLRFCRSFMEGLYPHLDPSFRPADWEGQVPRRELDYLTGQYERLAALSGGQDIPRRTPVMPRAMAAGHGLCHFAQAALRRCAGARLEGQAVLIAGRGPTGAWAGELAVRMGARVTIIGDESACLYAEAGLPLALLRDMGERPGLPLLVRAIRGPGIEYRPGPVLWDIPADVVFLCGGMPRVSAAAARRIMANSPSAVFEGAIQATTAQASRIFAGAALYGPGILSGACGEIMACAQGPAGLWEADRQLRAAMETLLQTALDAGGQAPAAGARALAFRRLADAMLAKGI